MEKITKEELKNLLGGEALSDDELEKISGGNKKPPPAELVRACTEICAGDDHTQCMNNCLGLS